MANPQPKLTAAEYLAIERQAETKSEFLNGEMFAMSGASRGHNLIVANLLRDLGVALRSGDCEVYPSDMRVHLPVTGLYAYPDVTVICGVPKFLDDAFDTLLNPTLLVEVLSPSTADYDRGRKFEHYRTIGSLQEFLLVDQESVHVVRYEKRDDGKWILSETRDRSVDLQLAYIGASLKLDDVYAKVDLDDASSGPMAV